MSHRIYGAEVSPYSVKVRSYFRYKGIPHEWIVRSQETMADYQKYAKLPLIPLVVAPDGKSLAVGCADKSIYLLDAQTQTVRRVLRGHRDQVLRVAFSPDGTQLASGSWNGEVRLWPVESGAGKLLRTAQPGAAWSVSFSADGRYLAAGGGDGARRVPGEEAPRGATGAPGH